MVLTQPGELRVQLPLEAIAAVCRRYGVSELAVFGSVLREDFQHGRSDIDFLVRFIDNDAGPWMSKFMDMEEEMGRLLACRVQLTDWTGVLQSTNPYRRNHILRTARTIYVA